MATYKSTTLSRSHSFIRSPNPYPQLEGNEGKEVASKIEKVTREEIEPIQRLVKSIESLNYKRNNELKRYLHGLQAEVLDREYPNSCSKNGSLEIAWYVWSCLRDQFADQGLCLEVPDAGLGENKNLMYVWSKAEHYLECEIFLHSKEIEFFYRNRNSKYVWGKDVTLDDLLNPEVLEKLSLFAW